MSEQLRARVLLLIRVPAERTEDFLRAYQSIRHQVAEGVPGHLVDQVCRSATDPEQWLITSEWVTLEHFERWERSDGHRQVVRPLRECFTEARSLRFLIREQTPSDGLRPLADLPAPRSAGNPVVVPADGVRAVD